MLLNLATLQTPLVTFSLQKSVQALFSFWELPVLPREREVMLSQRARTPLSLCVRQLGSAPGSWGAALLVKQDIMLLL